MAKKKILQISILISFVLFFSIQLFASEKENLIQIQKAIAEKGANWTAGTNWVTKLTREEQRRLCGTILEKPDPSEATLLSLPQIDDLPAEFDWRDNNGNWVTPVTSQGNCGSCWDFSAVAQVEAWWKIHNTNLDSMIDLSEQFVLSCSDGGCDGWSVSGALDFVKENGIPTESCFHYLANDTIPCSNACPDWQNEAIKIPGWGYITLDEPIVDNIKNAVYKSAPISYDYRGFKFGNTFLVGEAGGFASGLTGEGIYQSLVSGEAAAQIIVDENHEPEELNAVIKYNSIQYKILRVFSNAGIFLGPIAARFHGNLQDPSLISQNRLYHRYFPYNAEKTEKKDNFFNRG